VDGQHIMEKGNHYQRNQYENCYK